MKKLVFLALVTLLSLSSTCIAATPYYFTSDFKLSLYSKNSTYEKSGYFPYGDAPASMFMSFTHYFDKNGNTHTRDNTNTSCRINARKTKLSCKGFQKQDPQNGDMCTVTSDLTVTLSKPLSKGMKKISGWGVLSLSLECYSGYYQWAVYNGPTSYIYKPAR